MTNAFAGLAVLRPSCPSADNLLTFRHQSTGPPYPQILCDPAKLVLTKTPGACTHKYKSGSTWVGHECKITGGAGFSKVEAIGGGNRTIPLIDIDIGYEA